MSRPEDLRQITDNTLHSLIADESLKFRILQKAASSEQIDKSRQKRLIPVFCTVLAALLIAAVSLNSIQAVPSSVPGELNSFTAGGTDHASSFPLPEGFDPDSVLSVEMEGLGTVNDPGQCAALTQLLIDQSISYDQDPDADGKLIITSSGGQTFVFEVSNPYLISQDNQCWSCPGFFSEFSKMIK